MWISLIENPEKRIVQIELLSPERLRYWCGRLALPKEAVEKLVEIADSLTQQPELMAVFADFYQKTAVRGEWMREWQDLPFDPIIEAHFGQDTSMFYLLAYLSALPITEQEYMRRGIPLELFDATMSDIRVKLCDGSELAGYWRFTFFPWIWRHLACELFLLGRLQYMRKAYDGHAAAFRHRSSGIVRLLCGVEVDLRADGYALGDGEKETSEVPWRAVFEESPAGWRGHMIAPQGFALKRESFLLRSEWDRILQPGDTILDIHIPRGDSLTVEDCRDSLQRAASFFQSQFPDQPSRAFFCHTWMFSPQLQTILSPVSRIVQFQREFYLYPNRGGPGFLWEFVFGQRYPNPDSAPRDTSLRRAVLDWLTQDKEIFDLPGLAFHSPAEWGAQPYTRDWDAQWP